MDDTIVPDLPEQVSNRPTEAQENITVLVLGPVEVTGWANPPSRAKTTEILVYLATHPERMVPAERLRSTIWQYDPDRPDVALATVHQEISRLRRSLGGNHLPEAKGGYLLADTVQCDWAQFQAHVEAARALPEDAATTAYSEALALVRGAPFPDTGNKSYSWAFEEVLVARMEATISQVAHSLATKRLGERRLADAAWAVRQGLAANPRDETLRSDHLEIAAASGAGDLDRAWREITKVFGSDGISAELAAVYQRLRGAW